MPHRRVVDSEKNVWDVWDVNPTSTSRRLPVPSELQGGWLAFQCGEDRRRIAPLPAAWSEMTDTALLDLMAAADQVRPRIRFR